MRRLSLAVVAVAVAVATACAPDSAHDAFDQIRDDLRAATGTVDAQVGSGQLLPSSPLSISYSIIVPDLDSDLMEQLLRDTAERIWHTSEVRRIGDMAGSASTEDLAHTINLGEALGLPDGGFTVTTDDLEAVFGPRFADS